MQVKSPSSVVRSVLWGFFEKKLVLADFSKVHCLAPFLSEPLQTTHFRKSVLRISGPFFASMPKVKG